MPPKRRASDRGWVVRVGWLACLFLAGSLGYTFVRALSGAADAVDPLFFGMQTVASLLFLVYSLKVGNRVFVAANSVALFNAAGTLLVTAVQ